MTRTHVSAVLQTVVSIKHVNGPLFFSVQPSLVPGSPLLLARVVYAIDECVHYYTAQLKTKVFIACRENLTHENTSNWGSRKIFALRKIPATQYIVLTLLNYFQCGDFYSTKTIFGNGKFFKYCFPHNCGSVMVMDAAFLMFARLTFSYCKIVLWIQLDLKL